MPRCVALGVLGGVGPLPTLIPPPGSTAPASGEVADVDDPVLVKVRALLAQAESTTFDAEAAAFTAKAQELMARHAIDAAVLWASSERDERPTTIRLPIDDPYADIKALLLHHVALRSRCRAVRHVHYGLVSVVGFASDVAAAELLFTSLLVQSQAALQAEGAKAAPGARARSRSFRSSFLLSFTRRVDQRLAEINAAVEGGAADDTTARCCPCWPPATTPWTTRWRRCSASCAPTWCAAAPTSPAGCAASWPPTWPSSPSPT